MYKFSYRSIFNMVKSTSLRKLEMKSISCLFGYCSTSVEQRRKFITDNNSTPSYIFGDDQLKAELENFISAENKITSYEERCVIRVSKFFNADVDRAREVVNSYPELLLEEIDESFERCKHLNEKYFPLETIFKNIWLLDCSDCKYDHYDVYMCSIIYE